MAYTQQRVTQLQGERMMGRDDARWGAGTEEKVEGEGEGKKGNENDRKMWGKTRENGERKRGIGERRGEERRG